MKKPTAKELVKQNPQASIRGVEGALAAVAALRKRGRSVGGYRLDHPFGTFQAAPEESNEARPDVQTEHLD